MDWPVLGDIKPLGHGENPCAPEPTANNEFITEVAKVPIGAGEAQQLDEPDSII